MITICDNCLMEYSDENGPVTPAEELGQFMIDAMQPQDTPSFCPNCREELGILYLLGFEA